MCIPVLVFLIVLGAFSAEKLLLCSTPTPLVKIRKQMTLRLPQKRQEKLKHKSQWKNKTRTNKQNWSRKERKRNLPAEGAGTSAWNSSVLLFILNHFLTIFMDQASFIQQNSKEFLWIIQSWNPPRLTKHNKSKSQIKRRHTEKE